MRFLTTIPIVAGLIVSSIAATAQVYRDEYGRERENRERGYRGEDYRGDRVSAMIGRVHSDLERAQANPYLSRGDRKRIERAQGNLRDFQNRWAAGRFDRHELDETIGSVQSVVHHTRPYNRERDALIADLQGLRQLRASYSGYRPAPYR